MGKKKRAVGPQAPTSEAAAPFNNPFGSLGGLEVKPGPPNAEVSATSVAAAADAADGEPARFAGKLVVRRERKGHGGKTVTLLQGLTLGADARRDLARELAKKLGTGARVEGADVVVAGDQTERVVAWLHAQGAARVVTGG